jgi:hypothetical protein
MLVKLYMYIYIYIYIYLTWMTERGSLCDRQVYLHGMNALDPILIIKKIATSNVSELFDVGWVVV